MLVIRLSRIGRKDNATYRLVVSENTKDTFGDYLELLGSYNTSVHPKIVKFEKERIQYWISKGAQPSATVHNLLIDEGIIEGKKVKASRNKKSAEAETKEPEAKPVAKVEADSTEKPAEEIPAEKIETPVEVEVEKAVEQA
jgi:small subunit ribosomal protein S16